CTTLLLPQTTAVSPVPDLISRQDAAMRYSQAVGFLSGEVRCPF
ncbi:hypothetical protein A2U01_0111875, partial [Trifolium medium]|nr:hypothetical protein [Trifolium medium]